MPDALYEENVKIHKKFTNNWKNCFTKYKLFDLTEYDKIVFLDADIMVLKNLDDLFDKPNMTACVDGEYFNIWPNYLHFNAGCLVIEPSHGTYLDLLKELENINHEKY